MQHAIQTRNLDSIACPGSHDVADACAVALCHYQIERSQLGLLGR